MGIRFFRRKKIFPGITLNISRSGPSISVGGRGARMTIGPKGTRRTVGIPGSGISYTESSRETPGEDTKSDHSGVCITIAGVAFLLFMLFLMGR